MATSKSQSNVTLLDNLKLGAGNIVYVTDAAYGAVSGAADSLTQFNLAQAGATSSGEVFIPAGTWNLSGNTNSALWDVSSKATLAGAGALTGSIIAHGHYAPAWVNTIFSGAFAYMPSASTHSTYGAVGGIGYFSANRGNGTISTNANISFAALQYNNSAAGASSWCFYGTTVADAGAAAGTTQAMEVDVARKSTHTGAVYGMAINAGGEIANQVAAGYLFQSVDAAILIAANNVGGYANVNFNKGIVFAPNSVAPASNTAISLQTNYAVRWFLADQFTAIGSIYANATTFAQSQSIVFSAFGTLIQNSSNQIIVQVDNSLSSGVANRLVLKAATTGNPAVLGVFGDANAALSLVPSGTGTVLSPTLTLTTAASTAAVGQIMLGATTASTVGAAGTAAALPANPLGYIVINVAGTAAKIPYYN